MTGREVAQNLRNSPLKWGRWHLHDQGHFCALGIKLHERGFTAGELDYSEVPKERLEDVEYDPPRGIVQLTCLNDSCRTKKELIQQLERPRYINMEFDIEGFAVRFARIIGKAYVPQS